MRTPKMDVSTYMKNGVSAIADMFMLHQPTSTIEVYLLHIFYISILLSFKCDYAVYSVYPLEKNYINS